MTELIRGSRIVVVDDHLTHLHALCDVLQHEDFIVTGLDSAESALSQLSCNSFDLLLTDLVMPNIDGLTLLQTARRLDPHIACVVMTGEASVETAIRAMKGGAFDYIVKPFKASTLVPILRRALEARRLRVQNLSLEVALRERLEELAAVNRQLDDARREAELANRAKSVFLTIVTHELRTPLNSILGFSQLLAAPQFPKHSGDQVRFANNITSASKHMLSLVNDMLDLSKIESGKLELHVTAMDLITVLSEAFEIVTPLAKAKRVHLHPFSSLAYTLCADPRRLLQVLVNLLSNAIKYNRNGGDVRVTCEQFDGFISVAIVDSGIGMTREEITGIFQPFSRIERENSGCEGTGLGLVITKHLVEGMGGRIQVESESGLGSTFRIDLPASPNPYISPAPANISVGGNV